MELHDRLRERLARALEHGVGTWSARVLASGWSAVSAASVARPLLLPPGLTIVGVGSAVLGGAGKTPFTAALARALAAEAPAVIGHSYRAAPAEPRVVHPHDAVAHVGDDALSLARLLPGIAVIVGPTRQSAIDHGARLGHRLLLVDGLLQTRPARIFRSFLVVDAAAPWGSGRCPPAGDLRAPKNALLAAADHVVALHDEAVGPPSEALPSNAHLVPTRIDRAITDDGTERSLFAIRDARVGALLTIARPQRVLASLAARGIRPNPVFCLADHAAPSLALLDRASREPVDLWLTTNRCATKLPAVLGMAPVLRLDHTLDVGSLARWILRGSRSR